MKKAMVWGASGGIGRALIDQLVSEDWEVAAVTRRPEALSDVNVHIAEADVSSPFEVQAAVTAVSQMVDEIDLWVYAAGDITATKVVDMSAEEWQQILDANLTGAFLASSHSLPLLGESAHMFFIGAISERLRLPGLAAYSAAKVGLEALAEVLGKEQRKRSVTIVRPGAVNTPFWEKVPMKLPDNAAMPKDVADQILEAYRQGHKGKLDLA